MSWQTIAHEPARQRSGWRIYDPAKHCTDCRFFQPSQHDGRGHHCALHDWITRREASCRAFERFVAPAKLPESRA